MEKVNIIRNDRGLDFGRIEKFVARFKQKASSKTRNIDNKKREFGKNQESVAYEHFGITKDFEAIKAIDKQIKELESKKEVYKDNIRKFTKIPDKQYNSYDTALEGSPIYNFIHSSDSQFENERQIITDLENSFEDEIWLAKNIDHAIEIVGLFNNKLSEV